MVAHVCSPSIGEIKTGRSEIQGHLRVKASLGYVRPYEEGVGSNEKERKKTNTKKRKKLKRKWRHEKAMNKDIARI